MDTYVIPLVKAHESYGFEILTGKELQGQSLGEAVKQQIASADATVFFATRRGPLQNGSWATSDWVIDEIKHAKSLNKELVYEFREEGVEYADKLHEARQYTVFQPNDRMSCLVELAKVINRWRGLNFRVRLTPKPQQQKLFEEQASTRRLRDKKYHCTLSIRQAGNVIYGPKDIELHREGECIVLYTGDLPAYVLAPGAVLEVDLQMGDEVWSASRDSFTTVEVALDRL